jgi:hypothetical protein
VTRRASHAPRPASATRQLNAHARRSRPRGERDRRRAAPSPPGITSDSLDNREQRHPDDRVVLPVIRPADDQRRVERIRRRRDQIDLREVPRPKIAREARCQHKVDPPTTRPHFSAAARFLTHGGAAGRSACRLPDDAANADGRLRHVDRLILTRGVAGQPAWRSRSPAGERLLLSHIPHGSYLRDLRPTHATADEPATSCQRSRHAVRTQCEHHADYARPRSGHAPSSDPFDLRGFRDRRDPLVPALPDSVPGW